MRLDQTTNSLDLREIELEICKQDVVHFLNTWVWTFDPRRVDVKGSGGAYTPFDLFERQAELCRFLDDRVSNQEDGLVEKSRDIGYTWVTGGYATHRWLFMPGFNATFASRITDQVDKIGNIHTILEKIRMLITYLPAWMLPRGFNPSRHLAYMRLINPENGNLIAGEGGKNLGRGGRSSMFFIDEAAFLENGDAVDAATSGNSDVRIWGSTVNGLGNTFARKRHGGSLRPDQIFRFHYTDDPRKTSEWAQKKRQSFDLPHIWASEYDIDYSASVEGIAIPAKWVQAAFDLPKHFKVEPARRGIVGADVGAGKAKSVAIGRFGPVVVPPSFWLQPDTTETAHRIVEYTTKLLLIRSDGYECQAYALNYDNVGVGRGVQSTITHSQHLLHTVARGVNTGQEPTDTLWPDGESSKEKFVNLKAEIWWKMRADCKASYEKMLFATKAEGGVDHPLSDCIAFPDESNPGMMQLKQELSLPKYIRTEKGKIMIEPKDRLAQRGIASTDFADGLGLTYADGSTLDVWERLGAAA